MLTDSKSDFKKKTKTSPRRSFFSVAEAVALMPREQESYLKENAVNRIRSVQAHLKSPAPF